MNIADITITSIETVTAFDINTGAYRFTLDELQNATIAQSQDSTEITGKQGRRLATLKRNKAVTISGTNGLVSHGLLEMQTGSDFDNTTTKVLWTDYLTVTSQSATTSYKAVGTAGAEIDGLYIKNADGTVGAELVQDSTASAGKFTYDPATKALGFYTDVADNTEIVVYYKRNITANVLSDSSDVFSGKCALYIDALGEDKCANVYRVQIYVPKADFNGEFSFEMGDNQTVHAFEANALGGACGAGGNFFTYTVFGANAPDSPFLSSVAITTAPTKTSYNAGEAFSAAGMVLTASYSDGSSKAVTGYTFAPTGPLATTDTSVTVTYSEGGITKTATQAITVS